MPQGTTQPPFDPAQFASIGAQLERETKAAVDKAKKAWIAMCDAQIAECDNDGSMDEDHFVAAVKRITRLPDLSLDQISEFTGISKTDILAWSEGSQIPKRKSKINKIVDLYEAVKTLISDRESFTISLKDKPLF